MLFNSFEFLVLVAGTFLFYYAPWSAGRHGKTWQVSVLLTASVIFYGWQDARLLFLLAISCIGNSVATTRIIVHRISGDQGKVVLWTRWAVILNLGLLAIFKYATFIAGLIPFVPPSWINAAAEIPLPIGISFYTFHGISMIIDVARGQVKRESDQILGGGARIAKGLRDLGLYLVFFPQLVAGPIMKAKDFWPQIAAKRVQDIPWRTAIRSLIVGYFLKMFVADNLAEQTAILTMGATQLQQLGSTYLISLLYGYSFQIFADFAGYSLIAYGLAALFGYRLPINFNFPYISTSVTEFWRRWHMSLSAWLRDYLYVPLGGNRKGPGRTYLNLFLVMFLGGLWHGAKWKFAMWGSLHGVLLAAERLFRSRGAGEAVPPTKNVGTHLLKFAGWFYTFNVVTILWLTFLMPDVESISTFFRGLHRITWDFRGPPVFVLLLYGGVVICYHLWGFAKEHWPSIVAKVTQPTIEGILHGVMAFLIITNSGAPRGFIYFQF